MIILYYHYIEVFELFLFNKLKKLINKLSKVFCDKFLSDKNMDVVILTQ